MDTNSSPTKPRRGIYLLPNLLTTGAMFAGFYAIIAAIAGQYADAVIAVFVAGLLDGLDGRVARLTNTQSEFGVQYDSLSDLVSFGLAPALVMYVWSLQSLKAYGPAWGKLGWAAAFIFAACGALRLARFNTQAGVADKRYFQGLAIPAGAGLVMSYVWTVLDLDLAARMSSSSPRSSPSLPGLLMVSRFRYFSFKTWPSSEKVPFVWIPRRSAGTGRAGDQSAACAVRHPRVVRAVRPCDHTVGALARAWPACANSTRPREP